MRSKNADVDLRPSEELSGTRPRRGGRIVWILCTILVLIVAGIVGYRRFVLPDAEPPLVLGQRENQRTEQPMTSASATIEIDDVLRSSSWTTTGDSIVGYRVDEVVAGVLDETVTGRTNAVEGIVIIEDSQLVEATFDVDMTTLDSGSTARDAALERSQLVTDEYPTATFALTGPVDLEAGNTASVTVSGDLTLRGRTASTEAQIDARIIGNELQVLGTIPVDFDTYGIDLDPLGVSIDNTQAEFSLVLRTSDT